MKSRLVFFSVIIILLGFSNIFNNFQITLFNSVNSKPNQSKVLSYNVKNFNERNKNTFELVTKKQNYKLLDGAKCRDCLSAGISLNKQ